MFHIFLERNQSFSGDVSVAGHSLGNFTLYFLFVFIFEILHYLLILVLT